jgi:hypothetical protein
MTATESNILKSIMPDVVNFILSGMNQQEAILAAINKQNLFINEMIEMKTERSKSATEKICNIVYNQANA